MYLTLKDHLSHHDFFPSLPTKSQEEWRLAPLEKYLEKSYRLRADQSAPKGVYPKEKFWIQIHDGKVVEHTLPPPVHLKVNAQQVELHVYEHTDLYIYAHFTQACYHHMRLNVIVHEGVNASLYWQTSSDANSFITLGFTLKLYEHARMNQCLIEKLSPTSAMIIQEDANLEPFSRLDSFYDLLQGEYLHHILNAHLRYQAALSTNALISATEQNKMLFVSHIHHHSDLTRSEIRCKEVLKEQAQAVFDCTTTVVEQTRGCEVFQSAKALLLSEQAQVFSKPRLQIYCDELKASHGSTVGALDEEALEYLCSRGISHEKATTMLIDAFVNELLDQVKKEEHRRHLEELHHV